MDQAVTIEGTLLQKKQQRVPVSKEENLLILRGYRAHPTKWMHIVEDVKSNIGRLSEKTKDLYRTSSMKKLKERVSTKLGKLMCMNLEMITDDDIRSEVEAVQRAERRLIQTNQAAPVRRPHDHREAALAYMSDSSADDEDEPRRRPGDIQDHRPADPTAIQAGPAHAQPRPGDAHPVPIVVRPGPVNVQPGPINVQPGPILVQPGPINAQPGPVHVQPGPIYAQPGPILVQPGPVNAQPVPINAQPGPVLVQPGPINAQPGPVLVQPGPVLVQPGPINAQPGPVLVQPGPVLVQPGPINAQPGPILVQPGPINAQPGPVNAQPGPAAGQQDVDIGRRRRRRKRPLAELIRENQLEYNRFIKKKIPKILRELGISSSSDED